MRTSSPASLSAVLVASLAARNAAACFDVGEPCTGVEAWAAVEPIVTGAGIPTDGMLLLRFTGTASGEPVPAQVELQVTLDGVPVPGALEDIGVSHVLGWRPAAPLVPGGQYVVEGTLTNPDLRPGQTGCGEDLLPLAFEFAAAADPMPPLTQPPLASEETLVVTGAQQLDNLVCCDGAYPFESYGGCGGVEVLYEQGHCAYLQSTGHLRVDVTPELAPSAMTSMLHVELRVDGVPDPDAATLSPFGPFVLVTSATKPFCTELVVRNVVTGDTLTTPQQCHGQDLAAQLGPQSLTPDSPELAEHCNSPAYQCMIDESLGQWDPERCEPWPPGEGTTGEGTTGAPTTGGEPTGTTGDATTGGSDGGSAGPGADGLVDHGCACAGAPAAPGALAVLLALACAPRRRRR